MTSDNLNLTGQSDHMVKILGSGNWDLANGRHPPAILLQSGTTKVLLDAGYGTYSQLIASDCSPTTLTGMCISHFHPDHFADAVPIANAIVLAKQDNLKPFIILGPPGLRTRWQMLHSIFCCEDLQQKDKIQLFVVQERIQTFTFQASGERGYPIIIEPFDVDHILTEVCCGFVCGFGNKKVVYTGDLGPEQDWKLLGQKAHAADLLIIEAGAEDESSKSHITAARAIEFAQACRAKQTVLNHIPKHRYGPVLEMIHERKLEKSIEVGEDFQEFDL